jgi:hypothetical protein
MTINIGNLAFDGPHLNSAPLLARSGVYAILGRRTNIDTWTVVDIGESGDVKNRVDTHDRSDHWKRQGYSQLAVAAYYCDEATRMRLEQALRKQYNPPCGVR